MAYDVIWVDYYRYYLLPSPKDRGYVFPSVLSVRLCTCLFVRLRGRYQMIMRKFSHSHFNETRNIRTCSLEGSKFRDPVPYFCLKFLMGSQYFYISQITATGISAKVWVLRELLTAIGIIIVIIQMSKFSAEDDKLAYIIMSRFRSGLQCHHFCF